MDAQRRKRAKRKLAFLVVALAVAGMLALAYYDSEGRKGDAANAVAVAVRAPLTEEQARALTSRFERYAPEDSRAPVTLTVYVLSGAAEQDKLKQAAQEMNAGFPNLYLIEEQVRGDLAGLVELESLEARYPQASGVTDGVYYAAAGTEFWNADGLEGMPPCYLALQRSDSYAVTKDAQTQSYYAYQSALLDNIVHNTPPEEDS